MEIEGVNYGDFGYISDPYEIANVKKRQEEKFIRIHLKRDFVTDPRSTSGQTMHLVHGQV